MCRTDIADWSSMYNNHKANLYERYYFSLNPEADSSEFHENLNEWIVL